MMKKFFITVFFLSTLFFQNLANAYSSDPKQFISEIVEEAKKNIGCFQL